MDILHELLRYPAFRGLLYLVVAMCFVMVGVVAVLMVFHLMFSLGRKSALYKKRQPVQGWSKRFYPACGLLVLTLVALALWLKSLV